MALDESKLENVRRKDGKFTARCPACAEKGGDRKGEHLVVYDDGAYHCVATNGESRHSKRIFALAGMDAKWGVRATAPVLKKWGIRTIPGWNPMEW
jgi:hypothetical protein